VRDSVNIAPLPSGIIEGINYIDSTKVILCLFAPFKEYAFVIGDFNDWMPDTAYYMNRTPDGKYFWLEINNLTPKKEYIFQYFVDGSIKVGDPYAEKVSDPWNDSYITAATYPNMLTYPSNKTKGIATVLQTNQKEYQWKNQNFVAPKEEDLVVYELLIRDFNAKHTFDAVVDSLNYLKTLGINAIELMPVNEFEGNNSWGYNPNYYFAVDKYYGPKDRLKHLIDTCHSQGIAVILDVVYNHSFGTSPYVMLWWDDVNDRPAANSPFFNAIPKHDFNVGFDMNHESAATRKYISRSLVFWTEKYKVDGFRFDLSKGFTQTNTLGNPSAMANYDASRIYTLNRYADSVWAHNSNAYVILEHFADNSEEKDLSSRGMMLWGNLNNNYAEAAMGYNNSGKSDFSWISYQLRGWSEPHVMGYMESHDEERLMYKCSQWGNTSGNYSIKDKSTYMERASLDAMLFLTVPGPKMIWQFGELGYDISIDENGRTGEKPIKWEYFNDTDRRNNYLIYKALIDLRKDESACFQTNDYSMNVSGALKTITLRDTSMNAVVVGNFDVEIDTATISFPHDGIWYDYLSQQEIEIKNNKFFFKLLPDEYHLITDKKKDKPELAIKPKSIITDTLNFTGSLKIFPNPSDGEFYIYINSIDDVTINIYDINGRIISEKNITPDEKQLIRLNTKDLQLRAGVYFCSMQSSEGIITKKFIVL
jgi:glycosidase